MTTFTKADLATRILRDAGLIGAEETPSAIDLAFVEETLSSEIDFMAAKGILVWNGNETSIPNEYLTPLSRRICAAIGPAFGLFSVIDAEQVMESMEGGLRHISSIEATGAPVENEFI